MSFLDAPPLTRNQADTRYQRGLGKISADQRSTWTVGGAISPAAYLSHMTRNRLRSTFAGSGIELEYAANQGIGEGNPTGDQSALTVLASIEYPAGTFHPAYTATGQRALTMSPGAGITGTLYVDGVDIPAATDYWVRTKVYAASTGGIVATAPSDGVTEWALRELATPGTDCTLTNTGAPSANTITGYGPQIVRMAPFVPQDVCVGLVGDSVLAGNADPAANASGTGSPGGFAIRALSADGVTGRSLPGVPNVQMGQPGETLANWATPAKRRARLRILDATNCNNFLVLLSTNDIFGTATATLQANLLSVWRLLAQRGRVFAFTITPITANPGTTDNFATLENQTAGDPTMTAKRVALNQWLRAGAPIDPGTGAAVAVGTSGAVTCGTFTGGVLAPGNPAHPLYAVSDTGSTVESSLDAGFWKTNGTANAFASNYLHPSQGGHIAMAARAVEIIPQLKRGR